jgi:hypothetical protein
LSPLRAIHSNARDRETATLLTANIREVMGKSLHLTDFDQNHTTNTAANAAAR